jgi:hypothetical protein
MAIPGNLSKDQFLRHMENRNTNVLSKFLLKKINRDALVRWDISEDDVLSAFFHSNMSDTDFRRLVEFAKAGVLSKDQVLSRLLEGAPKPAAQKGTPRWETTALMDFWVAFPGSFSEQELLDRVSFEQLVQPFISVRDQQLLKQIPFLQKAVQVYEIQHN